MARRAVAPSVEHGGAAGSARRYGACL